MAEETERRPSFGSVSDIIARNHARKGKLTAFQAVLCREFMLDHNQTQAYLRAGGQAEHPGPAAGLQFRRAAVKAEIARLEEEALGDYDLRKQAIGLEKDWVIAEAKRNLMVAAGYEPVTTGVKDDGTLIKTYRPDLGVVRLQLVDLARELGMLMGGKDAPAWALTQNNLNIRILVVDADGNALKVG